MFLRGQSRDGVLAAGAHLFPSGLELAAGAFGEGVGAHGRKRVKCGPQLGVGLHTTVVAPQPLAVTQARPSEVRRHAGPGQQIDGAAVELVGDMAVGHQCPRKRRRTRALSVPLAEAIADNRLQAAAASAGCPLRIAASTSSGSGQCGMTNLSSLLALCAATAASSYSARPLYSTALAYSTKVNAMPSPRLDALTII